MSDPFDPISASVTPQPEEIAGTVEETDAVTGAVAEHDELFVVLEEVDDVEAQIADEQGLRGAPGRNGRDGAPGGRVARMGLGPVTGGQVVRAEGPLYVRPASALDPMDAFAILGVAYHGASDGDDVEIVVLGAVEDSSWQFIPNMPVFPGPTGLLTQTILPGFAFVRPCGIATSSTTVFVDLATPIFLAQG